ncbi:stability/partitioning protein [Klebsiella pneumoniae]|uniref:Stability/partitioning protein n=1 Tax=Klebsiella pneumoniae TaxID=573 RepID=A0A447RXD1_KLEPN|nr:stability/partitioning protein [Klebsiella pneumoniae]
MINNSIERLTTRVLTAIDSFKGYSHAIVIGGGAPLVATPFVNGWVCARIVSWWLKEPQFALVRGLKIIG